MFELYRVLSFIFISFRLISLECLMLNDCALESVSFDAVVSHKTTLFPNLKELQLKANNLRSWVDIGELNKLPALEILNVKANPVIDEQDDYEVAFNYVIVRIGGLKVLNREMVSDNVRKEASIYYYKKFYDEWSAKKDNSEFVKEHPRFETILSRKLYQYIIRIIAVLICCLYNRIRLRY